MSNDNRPIYSIRVCSFRFVVVGVLLVFIVKILRMEELLCASVTWMCTKWCVQVIALLRIDVYRICVLYEKY